MQVLNLKKGLGIVGRSVVFGLLLVSSVAGAAEIKPPDVYARVDLVRRKVEQLRWYLGRPKNQQSDIEVGNAAPREVYFQALTMFRKADRLAFEQVRETLKEPKAPNREPTPADVMGLVETVRGRLDRLRNHFGLTNQLGSVSRDPAKTPTDVFRSIVQANRQLDLLLDERMSPGDVYRQVTACIGYTSSLLATFPSAERLPRAPKWEPGKRPQDVYGRLIACFELLADTGGTKGVSMLELGEEAAKREHATPNDVYAIASLLLAELEFLHTKFPNAPAPRSAFYVGRKVPSDVYQRAGMLEKQLQDLVRLTGGRKTAAQ